MTAKNENRRALNWIARVGRWLVISQFAIWIGGFTFYAAYVVPIGNEVLGSARAQGFITQQVSHWLNFVCLVALVLMAIDGFVNFARKRGNALRRLLPLICVILIFLMLLALAWLHQQMDSLLDASDQSVKDQPRFYQLHRIYLWLSTIQWFVAWIWLFSFLNPRSQSNDS